ncbi:MAG: tape measure protein [Bacteroides xylanisolvens]
MAGKLSFSIAINLLTENFKRGSNQVKAAFRSMQMQFLTFAAALGAGGLGLSNFVSRLIEVARETNRVTTALKNVSGSMLQYADNQRYLLDLAKKYGLEINALTANYAKFTAAASISGMSMMDQRKVFESVSRACTAFGMSADDSNGVMIALSQMMSKGKISSEELRLQMGERLPVALQAMAKAAGVSVAGLDKLMKKGKLMSADVLPKFAEALNEMISNVDTDNLETSVNRLKNAFTDFTNNTGIQDLYKQIVDGTTKAVQYVQKNLKTLLMWIVSAISGYIGGKVFGYITAEFAKMQRAALVAAKKMAKEAGQAFDEAGFKANRFYNSAVAGAAKLNLALKSAVKSLAPMMIIAGIMQVVQVIGMWRDRQKEVNEKYNEYLKGAQKAGAGNYSEIIKLTQLRGIVNDTNNSYKTRVGALNQLNKLLGTAFSIDSKTLKVNGDLNKTIQQRVALMRNTALADYYTGQYTKALQDRKDLTKRKQEVVDKYNARHPDSPISANEVSYNRGDIVKTAKDELPYKTLELITKDLNNTNKILVDADKNSKAYAALVAKEEIKNTPITDPDDSKNKKTPLQKEQESFNKQFEELKAELEIGKITQAEYNKNLGELNIKMYAQAKGTGDKEVLESEYIKARKEAAEAAIKNQDKNAALVEFEKVQKDYNAKVEEARTQQAKGLMSQKDLNSNIASLSTEAAKSAAGIKGIGDEADVFITAMQLNAKLLSSSTKVKPRDTTFDYKKTKTDIASENLDKAKELADKYKEEARNIGKTLSDEVANAMANVPSLEEALKLAQVQEDIKNLNKELNESLYSGVKDIASSSDRIVSAFSNLRDVMNDIDATGWERIMAIWNAMTNVVDTFLSIIKMIESLTELTNKLIQAKEAEEVIDTAVTGTKVANAATETTAEITAIATQTAASVSANVAKTTAATTTMAAESTAAYAGIPFVGVGLAAAQIAAMEAMILAASIPKFATGGVITGGPTSGDKILARVNAGEMILNQRQQSRLFEAINSGQLGGSGNISSTVTTRVRAKDLILTINNELKSQGKKTIS